MSQSLMGILTFIPRCSIVSIMKDQRFSKTRSVVYRICVPIVLALFLLMQGAVSAIGCESWHHENLMLSGMQHGAGCCDMASAAVSTGKPFSHCGSTTCLANFDNTVLPLIPLQKSTKILTAAIHSPLIPIQAKHSHQQVIRVTPPPILSPPLYTLNCTFLI